MPDPVLHLLAGPNGAGKSSLHELVIGPTTGLEFVDADVIAAQRWPGDEARTSYAAAEAASARRRDLIDAKASFVTETVFSHESELELVRSAHDAGYLVTLHLLVVPVELTVARVVSRVGVGGHAVPEEKIRSRYERLWPLVVTAITEVRTAIVYDNSRAATPFRVIARFEGGSIVGRADWPTWAPTALMTEASS